MAVKIVSGSQVDSWINAGIDLKVRTYFIDNPGSTLEEASATLELPYEQVFWALSFISSGKTFLFQALPTNDSEMPLARAANSSM